MEIKYYVHKSPCKRLFSNGIHSITSSWCQRERWHHLPYLTHIATLWVKHIVIDVEGRSSREYVMPTGNIIMLYHFFNLTKKSNVIYDLTHFFKFGSGLLFGPPCILLNTVYLQQGDDVTTYCWQNDDLVTPCIDDGGVLLKPTSEQSAEDNVTQSSSKNHQYNYDARTYFSFFSQHLQCSVG